MTRALTLAAILFSTLAYGQMAKEDAYKSIDGLTISDSITWKDIVGGFYKTDGLGGYNFRLDSNMSFHKISFSCMERFTVDSGSWAVKDHNTVVLKSSKLTFYFDVVKFDNFYFFILPTQRQKFIKDLITAKMQFKNAKAFTIDDKTYSKDYLIGYDLVKKYYAKELEDTTGI